MGATTNSNVSDLTLNEANKSLLDADGAPMASSVPAAAAPTSALPADETTILSITLTTNVRIPKKELALYLPSGKDYIGDADMHEMLVTASTSRLLIAEMPLELQEGCDPDAVWQSSTL